MKKNLLLKMMVILSLTLLLSCEEEDLINGGSKSTGNTGTTTGNTNTSKCYIKDILETSEQDTYKYQFTYNAKNLLEKINNDGSIFNYEYDGNNRVTKLSIVDGAATEMFNYSYDSKGNMTNIKYEAKDTPFNILIKEFNLTTNVSGQVSKVIAVTNDGNIEFLLDYDAKNNVKKIALNTGTEKVTLIENLTFDDKSNVYANTGLSKADIPFVLLGAAFGENSTYYMNTNNILTDIGVSFLSDDVSATTYKYEFTKDGFPSKMSYVRIIGKDQETGSGTYIYDCK